MLLVTANSPGEVAGWLRPVARAWRKAHPSEGIVVILLPCTFATGYEARVAAGVTGVEEVIPVRDYWALLWKDGARFRGATLLHLGGDLMYSAFLSWRWKLRAWSYLWARPWWDSAFEGYVAKDQRGVDWLLQRRISHHKIHQVGDLLVDSVYQQTRPQEPDPNLVSFLPGSRVREVARLAPFFTEMAEIMQARRPELKFQLHLSPFIPQEEARTLLESPPDSKVGGNQGRLVEPGVLSSPQGVRIKVCREDSLESLAKARLAITLPGTKTGEAACLGVPCLTLVPLNIPDEIPFIGLIGLLEWVPGGARLKARLLLRMRDTIGLLAQPNLLAERELMPEIIEVVDPEMISRRALELLEQESHLKEVGSLCLALYAPFEGAAHRLVERLG